MSVGSVVKGNYYKAVKKETGNDGGLYRSTRQCFEVRVGNC